ncbi:MAG: ATP-binding cassette domain-containing protein [Fimbriimonadales bacterium]
MILSVSNITKAFGAEEILRGASLRVESGEKVALVGRNGTGKTTLLKIIAGQMRADSGSYHLAKGAKVGYLRQEAPVDPNRTVLGEAEEARRKVLELRKRLDDLELRLSQKPTEEEIEEYAVLHEHFLDEEGYAAEHDMRAVLQRMGFSESDFDKPASSLSGGEKTRLALARMLLEEPDLLILDEPTNHLDLEATEWLENWLKNYRGSAIIVSHDREFLQNVSQRIIEVNEGQTRSWPGPFDKYLLLKIEDEQGQADLAKKQQQEMAKLDEYVRRFLNSERVAQARGRKRHLDRMKANLITGPKTIRGIAGGFSEVARSGDLVLACKGLGMQYGGRVLFSKLDWTVTRGDKWGVVGQNGAGKSTLIRNALGLLEPTEGSAKIGANITIGYFSQDTVDLDPELTPLEMMNWECDLDYPAARNLLARFLITGDQVYQQIKTLSGGEKNKLVLAKITALKPNLLVLDEPTNHLDMDSRDALADVIKEFTGSVILVSHDRWLLSQVTTRTMDVRSDTIVQSIGSYAEYRRDRDSGEPLEQAPVDSQPERRVEVSQREISKRIERLEKSVERFEAEIIEVEDELKTHEEVLAGLPPEADFVGETRKHAEIERRLAQKLVDWENHSAELDDLRSKQGAAV